MVHFCTEDPEPWLIGHCIHVIMPSSTIILWSEVSDGSSIPDCLATSLCSVHEQLGDRKSSFTFKPRLLPFWYLHLSDCIVLYIYVQCVYTSATRNPETTEPNACGHDEIVLAT